MFSSAAYGEIVERLLLSDQLAIDAQVTARNFSQVPPET
jgi:hypothetical protein